MYHFERGVIVSGFRPFQVKFKNVMGKIYTAILWVYKKWFTMLPKIFLKTSKTVDRRKCNRTVKGNTYQGMWGMTVMLHIRAVDTIREPGNWDIHLLFFVFF